MKIQNKLAIPSIDAILTLIFSLQALAKKAEITGWDKAKFGMSPEELKKAYREEEEYFKPDIFWKEKREDKFSHTPYILSTSRFIIFREEGRVIFYFANNKLFEITITDGTYEPPEGEIEFMPGELLSRSGKRKVKKE